MRIGLNKKLPVYKDQCVEWLMLLSKAALADCVVDLLRGLHGIDDPVREDDAMARLEPVILLRGDKMPVTIRKRLIKRGKKLRSRRIFETACKLAGVES